MNCSINWLSTGDRKFIHFLRVFSNFGGFHLCEEQWPMKTLQKILFPIHKISTFHWSIHLKAKTTAHRPALPSEQVLVFTMIILCVFWLFKTQRLKHIQNDRTSWWIIQTSGHTRVLTVLPRNISNFCIAEGRPIWVKSPAWMSTSPGGTNPVRFSTWLWVSERKTKRILSSVISVDGSRGCSLSTTWHKKTAIASNLVDC